MHLGFQHARTKPFHPNKKSTNTKQNLKKALKKILSKKVLKKVTQNILTKTWKNSKQEHLSLSMQMILDFKRRQKMGKLFPY
jgi:hypothetical protein